MIDCESERSIKAPDIYHNSVRTASEALDHAISEFYQDRRILNKSFYHKTKRKFVNALRNWDYLPLSSAKPMDIEST